MNGLFQLSKKKIFLAFFFLDSSLLDDNKASTLCLTNKLTKELVDHIKASTKL